MQQARPVSGAGAGAHNPKSCSCQLAQYHRLTRTAVECRAGPWRSRCWWWHGGMP